jgi:hypothetical protein
MRCLGVHTCGLWGGATGRVGTWPHCVTDVGRIALMAWGKRMRTGPARHDQHCAQHQWRCEPAVRGVQPGKVNVIECPLLPTPSQQRLPLHAAVAAVLAKECLPKEAGKVITA